MSPEDSAAPTHHRPVWDRGQPIDAGMLAFTIGEDWRMDRELVPHDLRGSLAHAKGLHHVGLLEDDAYAAIRDGLNELLAAWQRGEWDVEAGDEDVHSAVERRLVEAIGEHGKRLHLGRSRNDQVAVDLRLWLRAAAQDSATQLAALRDALLATAQRHGELPVPGYTHLRRGMPSTLADWAGAHAAALALDAAELDAAAHRWSLCPLGSGAGYGVPLPLDRAYVARELGFDGAEEPVTLTQHQRGRPELAYLTALEGIALDLGKLATDLWLYTSEEFGFVRLPEAFTTGSSLMPHKRNPDLLELVRAHSRQVVADRAALRDVVRDLPSGYHRDFQLVKPPLFGAHARVRAMLPLLARLLPELQWNAEALRAADADPQLQKTRRALERAAAGEALRDAYRDEAGT